MECKICGSSQKEVFSSNVLGDTVVKYYLCDSCGFLSTEKPTWLEKAYSDAIASTDVGLVSRNLQISKRVAGILYFFFEQSGRFVDCAGGYGLFTRLMRDMGFDFYWDDPYCKNMFANGFNAGDQDLSREGMDLITAFEVMEHLEDPVQFIKDSMSKYKCKSFICTTSLFAGPAAPDKNWWYYCFDTGQHIAFYQKKTLKRIAQRLGLHLYSHKDFHIFTDRPINEFLFKLCVSSFSELIKLWIGKTMRSKLQDDYQASMARALGKSS